MATLAARSSVVQGRWMHKWGSLVPIRGVGGSLGGVANRARHGFGWWMASSGGAGHRCIPGSYASTRGDRGWPLRNPRHRRVPVSRQDSRWLRAAAETLSKNPASLQLRYLQTLLELGADQNSTAVFPLPVDIITPLLRHPEILRGVVDNFQQHPH